MVAVVAPRAGAWIEACRLAHPDADHDVAPRAGAWIEAVLPTLQRLPLMCRSPRGSVD